MEYNNKEQQLRDQDRARELLIQKKISKSQYDLIMNSTVFGEYHNDDSVISFAQELCPLDNRPVYFNDKGQMFNSFFDIDQNHF